MKATRHLGWAALGLGLAVVPAAWTATFSDNFNTPRDYLAQGLPGTLWEGLYTGAGQIPNATLGGSGPGSTVAMTNKVDTGQLVVTSVATDWEFQDADGVFLYKLVYGDFDAEVLIGTPYDPTAFNTAGLMARLPSDGGPAENYVSWTRFDQFGIANYFRNEVNGDTSGAVRRPIFEVNNNYWLRLQRVGNTFYAYERATADQEWILRDQQDRPDMDGLPVQVGLIHATFSANTLTAAFSNFRLTGPNVQAGTEAPPASGLSITTDAGPGALRIQWTPGAGSSGSLVVIREGGPLMAQPSDFTEYTANAQFGAGSQIGFRNYVVYAGSGNSVVVTGLSGAHQYHVAVYSYVGSGASINYTLAGAPTASARPPATLQSITLQLPERIQTNGFAQAVVIGHFDDGSTANLTAQATFQSSDPSVFAVNAAGLVTGVGAVEGAVATITATHQQFSASRQVTAVGPPPATLLHRYSFNTDASDSVGNAHGTLMNGATVADGELVLPNPVPPAATTPSSNPGGAYVALPPDLTTNLTAITWEAWVTDDGSATWARVFDFGSSTTRYMFLAVPGVNLTQTRFAYNAGGGEGTHQLTWTTGGGGRPQVGQKTHLVVTTDAETRRGVLYVNGIPVAVSATGFTNSPLTVGSTTNNWLGRSQFGGDPYWGGRVDEFRIWSNALTALRVAINAAAGPDRLVDDPGALQSIALLLPQPEMEVGAVQSAGVMANFANVSNVNVTAAGATFSSSDTNVLTVTAAGVVTAVAAGTADITASFGGQTTSRTVTVVPPPAPVLVHRYSFTSDARDSVGNAHGVNPEGGMVFNGTAVFDGVQTLELPPGIVSNYNSLTIEAWFYASNYHALGGPLYLYSFGERLPNGSAANFVRLALRDADVAAPVTQISLNGPAVNSGALIGGRTLSGGWNALLSGYKHVVAVYDGARQQMALYLDGELVQTVSAAAPLWAVSSPLAYLGKSLATTEPLVFQGALDEFRIYKGVLSLAQIRTSRAAGPDNPQLDPGAFSTLRLEVPGVMIQGTRRRPAVSGDAANAANIDLTGVAALQSSAPGVLQVLADGRIQAVAPGIATLTASYGGASTSRQVVVVPKQTALMHRYSFNGDLRDLVGGADARPHGNVTIVENRMVQLTGERNTYVELPRYLVDGYATITLEAWAQFLPSGNWTRLFDFGVYSAAARPGGVDYIFFAPRTGGASYRIAINPPGAEVGVTASTGAPQGDLNDGVMRHIVCVFQTDAALGERYLALYLDGAQVVRQTITADLSAIQNAWNFIGRSLFSADAYLLAQIDEFRIYHGALTPEQIAAHTAAGPDGSPTVSPLAAPLVITAARQGDNLVLTWTDAQAVLQSAPGVTGPYTDVSGASSPYTVPLTGSQQYFRLRK
ncbi:MAG: LamG domain-containing protein [Limisphaera sp.]|nr:LamG domain-containing protein [Limisphaera sp.]